MARIVFDIETIAKPVPDELYKEWDKQLRDEYQQEATIQKHLGMRRQKFCFDWEGAEIVCIGSYNVDTGEKWVEDTKITSPEELVSQWCGTWNSGDRLIGFNCKRFDLPVILAHLARSPLPTTKHLGRYDVVDLIEEPIGRSIGMRSLSSYARALGLGSKSADGSDVAKMWEEDKADGGSRVKEYCMQDVILTSQVYLAMRTLFDI